MHWRIKPDRLLNLLASLSFITVLITLMHFRLTRNANEAVCSFSSQQVQESINVMNVQLPTLCTDLACKAEYLKHHQLPGYDFYPIPAVRHLLWRNESVSAYFAEQLRTWQKIHPDWTVVLWRDEDLKPFVRKHFPGALARFLELDSHPIIQVDMIRYMLLYKFGGVYADLDYSLLRSLDDYRKIPATVTREPEAHALQVWGFQWPPRILASPAFLMSVPGHVFYRYCISQLQRIKWNGVDLIDFAGPTGLTWIIEKYVKTFPFTTTLMETIYVPPSYSFYPYEGNRMNGSNSDWTPRRLKILGKECKRFANLSDVPQLFQYCKDINNLDPITDKSQPIVAVHDLKKTGRIYDGTGDVFYLENLVPIRSIFPNLHLGRSWT